MNEILIKRALACKGEMGDNCVFCGKRFKSDICPHSFSENMAVIRLAPVLKQMGIL